MIMLAYYCMPQVFFYGVYVLAGQVLNARDKFGPMMWAPIANNVVSIVVLLRLLGRLRPHRHRGGVHHRPGAAARPRLHRSGIAVQAAVLIPFLRAAGYRFRPRWDFRHTGLGKTFRLAKWTLGFVLVTQAALVVVSRLATGATVGGRGAGLTAYANAYAVWILPHSLITVSLATAMLPAASRLAAAGDLAGVAEETMRAIRLAVTALLPAAVAFVRARPADGPPGLRLRRGAPRTPTFVGSALMALAVGLVPFTIQYICLRAFYALEDNRTTFFLQCLIAGGQRGPRRRSPCCVLDRPSLVATGLAAAYSLAYLIGVHGLLPRAAPAAARPERRRSWSGTAYACCSRSRPAAGRRLADLLGDHRRARTSQLALGAGAGAGRGGRGRAVPGDGPAAQDHRGDRDRRRPCCAAGTATRSRGGRRPAEDDLDDPGDSDAGDRAAGVAASSQHEPRDPCAVRRDANPRLPLSENAETMAQAVIDPHADAPKAATLPAGTVLAARYRLEELIAESRPTVTWRAFDQVLSRSVLVHLLSRRRPGDADDLLAAARRASVATDSRFLRVLDAVHCADPELGSYIVCEYATGQSLELVLSHGAAVRRWRRPGWSARSPTRWPACTASGCTTSGSTRTP